MLYNSSTKHDIFESRVRVGVLALFLWKYSEIEEDEDTDKIEALVSGDVVTVEMYGISRAYNDYIKILIVQIRGC